MNKMKVKLSGNIVYNKIKEPEIRKMPIYQVET